MSIPLLVSESQQEKVTKSLEPLINRRRQQQQQQQQQQSTHIDINTRSHIDTSKSPQPRTRTQTQPTTTNSPPFGSDSLRINNRLNPISSARRPSGGPTGSSRASEWAGRAQRSAPTRETGLENGPANRGNESKSEKSSSNESAREHRESRARSVPAELIRQRKCDIVVKESPSYWLLLFMWLILVLMLLHLAIPIAIPDRITNVVISLLCCYVTITTRASSKRLMIKQEPEKEREKETDLIRKRIARNGNDFYYYFDDQLYYGHCGGGCPNRKSLPSSPVTFSLLITLFLFISLPGFHDSEWKSVGVWRVEAANQNHNEIENHYQSTLVNEPTGWPRNQEQATSSTSNSQSNRNTPPPIGTPYKTVQISQVCEWKSNLFVPKSNDIHFAQASKQQPTTTTTTTNNNFNLLSMNEQPATSKELQLELNLQPSSNANVDSDARLKSHSRVARSQHPIHLESRTIESNDNKALVLALPLDHSAQFPGLESACSIRLIVPVNMRILAQISSRRLKFEHEEPSDRVTRAAGPAPAPTSWATLNSPTHMNQDRDFLFGGGWQPASNLANPRHQQQVESAVQAQTLWINVSQDPFVEFDSRSIETEANELAFRFLLERNALHKWPDTRLQIVATAFQTLAENSDLNAHLNPQVSGQNQGEQFICDQQRLISANLACDGYKNCQDGQDEHPAACALRNSQTADRDQPSLVVGWPAGNERKTTHGMGSGPLVPGANSSATSHDEPTGGWAGLLLLWGWFAPRGTATNKTTTSEPAMSLGANNHQKTGTIAGQSGASQSKWASLAGFLLAALLGLLLLFCCLLPLCYCLYLLLTDRGRLGRLLPRPGFGATPASQELERQTRRQNVANERTLSALIQTSNSSLIRHAHAADKGAPPPPLPPHLAQLPPPRLQSILKRPPAPHLGALGRQVARPIEPPPEIPVRPIKRGALASSLRSRGTSSSSASRHHQILSGLQKSPSTSNHQPAASSITNPESAPLRNDTRPTPTQRLTRPTRPPPSPLTSRSAAQPAAPAPGSAASGQRVTTYHFSSASSSFSRAYLESLPVLSANQGSAARPAPPPGSQSDPSSSNNASGRSQESGILQVTSQRQASKQKSSNLTSLI